MYFANVPQGSIFGPKLFNLCINDICSTSNLLKFDLFADDIIIFYSHQDIYVVLNIINNKLQKLYTWFAVSNLSLNTGKTHFMLFSNMENSLPCTVKICNIEIDRLYYTKFL